MADTMIEECYYCGIEMDCLLDSENQWKCERCMIRDGNRPKPCPHCVSITQHFIAEKEILIEFLKKVTPTKMELSMDSLVKIKDHDYMDWPVKAEDYRDCAEYLEQETAAVEDKE